MIYRTYRQTGYHTYHATDTAADGGHVLLQVGCDGRWYRRRLNVNGRHRATVSEERISELYGHRLQARAYAWINARSAQ